MGRTGGTGRMGRTSRPRPAAPGRTPPRRPRTSRGPAASPPLPSALRSALPYASAPSHPDRYNQCTQSIPRVSALVYSIATGPLTPIGLLTLMTPSVHPAAPNTADAAVPVSPLQTLL